MSAGSFFRGWWKARGRKRWADEAVASDPRGGTAACVPAPLSAVLRRMTHSAQICCYFPPAEGGMVTPPECLMDEALLPTARRKSPAEESQRDWCGGREWQSSNWDATDALPPTIDWEDGGIKRRRRFICSLDTVRSVNSDFMEDLKSLTLTHQLVLINYK